MRIAIALFFALLLASCDQKHLGEVEFLGYTGLYVDPIRAALPFHEGDPFPPHKISSDDLKKKIAAVVKHVIGRDPIDVAFVCCDARQNFMIYIGVPGPSADPVAYNPAPTENLQFPPEIVKLRDDWEKALTAAVFAGKSQEDYKEGYALANDPATREKEIAIHDYAVKNEDLIQRVLASSSDARQRAIAAQFLGYAKQSDAQIAALTKAALDPDGDVRNDSIRALAVMATVSPDLAAKIPADPFIKLLKSGVWTDNNKAAFILQALTQSRNPDTLAKLRLSARDTLIEMSHWRTPHAQVARVLLDRIAQTEPRP